MKSIAFGLTLALCLSCTSDPNALVIEGPKLTVVPEAPHYPPVPRMARTQGDVILRGSVSPEGRPLGLYPVAGPRQLTACALQYANSWRFEAIVDKPLRPVELRVRFVLESAPNPHLGWVIAPPPQPEVDPVITTPTQVAPTKD